MHCTNERKIHCILVPKKRIHDTISVMSPRGPYPWLLREDTMSCTSRTKSYSHWGHFLLRRRCERTSEELCVLWLISVDFEDPVIPLLLPSPGFESSMLVLRITEGWPGQAPLNIPCPGSYRFPHGIKKDYKFILLLLHYTTMTHVTDLSKLHLILLPFHRSHFKHSIPRSPMVSWM